MEAYATQDHASYYAETRAASAPNFESAAEDVVRLCGTRAAVIDIGGGDGELLRALHSRGLTDLYLHEIPGPSSNGLGSVLKGEYRDFDCASVPTGMFDAVTMMDVLEHAPAPEQPIATAKRILKRGGIFYVHTPAVSILDRCMHGTLKVPGARNVGRVWQRSRTSIFHLQNYTLAALRTLLTTNGFELLFAEQRTELSWPIQRYVQVYLKEKAGMPTWALGPLTPLIGLALNSRLNCNKAVLAARRL